jgi:signal transduction histidine kinase
MMASAHRRIRARPRSAALTDVAIAAAALAGSLAILGHGIGATRPGSELDLLAAAIAVAATVPLLGWRRAPLGVFMVTGAASTLAAGLGYALGIPLGPTAALYLLAVSRSEANPWTPRLTAAVLTLFTAYLAVTAVAASAFPVNEFFHTGLAWAATWFAGERTRLLRERIAGLKERAIQAEDDADRDRRLAVAEERARIARDLHDSAGHAINVIAVRAGAARLRHNEDPSRSLVALEAIEEVARETADDIDQIVHSLREDGSANAAQAAPPGLTSLDSLVGHHAQAGLKVAVRSIGTPRPLAHAADQAVYRILQEALTNAARHGTGRANLELAFRETALRLTITNPIRSVNKLKSEGGHGLIGMRERAVLLGGTFRAGRVNGAFYVSAQVPYGRSR